MGTADDKMLSLRIFKSNPPGAVAEGTGIDGRLRLCTGYLGIVGLKRTRCIVDNASEGVRLVTSRWGMPVAKIDEILGTFKSVFHNDFFSLIDFFGLR